MGMVLRMRNISESTVKYDMTYPDPGCLDFECLSFAVAQDDKERIQHKECIAKDVIYARLRPVNVLRPGESKEMVLYLNRFLSVLKPGRLKLQYHFDLRSWQREGKKTIQDTALEEVFNGTLSVVVVEKSQQELDLEMGSLVAQYDSVNRQRKTEILEAFSHLDTHLSIKHMTTLLHRGSFAEVAMVRALGHWNTPEVSQTIENMLLQGDQPVVEEALGQLAKQGKRISAQTAKKVLESPNPLVRFAALKRMPQVAGPEVAPLVEKLTADANPTIVKKAQECLRQLQDKK